MNISLDIAALRRLYQSGELTPLDLVEELLARMAGEDTHHIWISRLGADDAACLRQQPAGQGHREPAALRHPLRHQGQHRSRRPAYHRRLPRVRLHAGTQRHRRAAPDRRRRDPDRQNQPRPVRHRTERHPFALRRLPQRLQPGLHLRRLQFRLGGRRGAGPGELFARHRHRRFRPRARRVQQPRRPQAELRRALHPRRGARLPLARCGVDLCARPPRMPSACWRWRPASTPTMHIRARWRRTVSISAAQPAFRFGVPHAEGSGSSSATPRRSGCSAKRWSD